MTQTEITELATQLRPMIKEAVQEAIPDRIITVTEACKILGKKRINSVLKLIDEGALVNHGTGKQRPKLSYNEVARYKIERSKN